MALERQRTELVGSAEELAALQGEKAKADRIELLRRQVGRRIMNAGLSRGWTAWIELWEAKTYAMQTLRAVGNKLRSPEVADAFGAWADDVAEEKRAAEVLAQRSQLGGLAAELSAVKQELAALQVESEQRLAEGAAAHAADLQRLRVELTGMAEERESMRAAQDREARVQLVRRQVARRIISRGLVRGWTMWHGQWERRVRAQQAQVRA